MSDSVNGLRVEGGAVLRYVEHSDRAGLRLAIAHTVMRHSLRPVIERFVDSLRVVHGWGLPIDWWSSPVAFCADLAARFIRIPVGTHVEPIDLAGHKAELVRAANVPTPAPCALLLLHGGGYMAGGLASHRRMAAYLSAAANAEVLVVDYLLLARGGTITDATAAGVAGYEHLLGRGYEAGNIVLAGDSVGGHQAFLVALKLPRLGLPTPAGLVGMAPLLNLDHTAKIAHHNADRDPMVPDNGYWLFDRFLGTGLIPENSPVAADLAGLPPVLLHYGSTEVLLADGELMTERLAAAGVPVILKIWHKAIHEFQLAADLFPEARASLDEIGVFARTVVRDVSE